MNGRLLLFDFNLIDKENLNLYEKYKRNYDHGY